MRACDLFVQLLWQGVYVGLQILLGQHDPGQTLIGKAIAHDKAGVTRGTAQIRQTTLGQ